MAQRARRRCGVKLLEGVRADASLSPCGRYRYVLTRDWFPKVGTGHVLWVMLNPSTATEDVDDPTIRRCQAFARQWGYDGITVANLFGLRSTNPDKLLRTPQPIGEANDDVLVTLAEAAGVGLAVAAWGTHPATRLRARAGVVTTLVTGAGRDLHCLGTTAGGAPRHPLYVKGDQPAELWREAL